MFGWVVKVWLESGIGMVCLVLKIYGVRLKYFIVVMEEGGCERCVFLDGLIDSD